MNSGYGKLISDFFKKTWIKMVAQQWLIKLQLDSGYGKRIPDYFGKTWIKMVAQQWLIKLQLDSGYGHRLELPFNLVEQIREVFMRKSSFLVIFFLTGDLVWIVCCLGAFNREEDVVFGYAHFINTECCNCPLEHMEVIWHLCKIHWNGCDLVIFSTWVCLHADCEKSSMSTGVVLLSVQRP